MSLRAQMRALRNLAGLARRPKPEVQPTPYEVTHAEGGWRLLRFVPDARRFATPIVMVPSFINRWYVLDLAPGRSLVAWLVARGHEVYVVDWGQPGPERRHDSFDDLVGRSLRRVLRRACRVSGAERAHLLGYCMGGTLAVVHAAAFPERVATLTTLAAPVAFEADDTVLARWSRHPDFDVHGFVDALGNAPWPLLQAAFTIAQPLLAPSKWMFLMGRAREEDAWTDDMLDGFFAKERWANDNVSLPAELFRAWVQRFYRDDALIRGELELERRPVHLSALRMPLHVLTFEHDTIVPVESARPLATEHRSDDATHTHLPGGHVGAVVSASAHRKLWPVLAEWWEARAEGQARRCEEASGRTRGTLPT